jgi:Arc/MetJ-type ribon-helix-helix transcriptional regulator
MPTVEVVVSEGQKADWKTFVEETDEGAKYDSLSDLIRTAVEQQIARDLGEEGVPEEIEDMFFELQSDFEDLKSNVAAANESLEVLDNHQLDEDSVDRIVETHADIIQEELAGLKTDNDGSDSESDSDDE